MDRGGDAERGTDNEKRATEVKESSDREGEKDGWMGERGLNETDRDVDDFDCAPEEKECFV